MGSCASALNSVEPSPQCSTTLIIVSNKNKGFLETYLLVRCLIVCCKVIAELIKKIIKN